MQVLEQTERGELTDDEMRERFRSFELKKGAASLTEKQLPFYLDTETTGSAGGGTSQKL